jgi:hypothetical protein
MYKAKNSGVDFASNKYPVTEEPSVNESSSQKTGLMSSVCTEKESKEMRLGAQATYT